MNLRVPQTVEKISLILKNYQLPLRTLLHGPVRYPRAVSPDH